MFVNEFGDALNPRYLGDLVRRYLENAGITTRGSCHVFRHAMATPMLDNGADIRHIQAILGHARLETTQIYTRVSIRKLKEVHAATHPTGKLPPAIASTTSHRDNSDENSPIQGAGLPPIQNNSGRSRGKRLRDCLRLERI